MQKTEVMFNSFARRQPFAIGSDGQRAVKEYICLGQVVTGHWNHEAEVTRRTGWGAFQNKAYYIGRDKLKIIYTEGAPVVSDCTGTSYINKYYDSTIKAPLIKSKRTILLLSISAAVQLLLKWLWKFSEPYANRTMNKGFIQDKMK